MYHKILVPLDGSELAECVLPHVEAIAKGCGVKEIKFLRVIEPWRDHPHYYTTQPLLQIMSELKVDAESYLDKVVNDNKYEDVDTKSEVIEGKAADIIADYATKENIDLIIIATHGRSGVSRWVRGSVADRILHSACVPVLLIRAPGCVPGF